MNDIWMFVDPSLTTIGWCAVEFDKTKTIIVEADRIYAHGKGARLKNDAKVDLMVRELELKLGWHRPSHIVIEIPSGKVNESRHRGRGSGLSVYGFAVGHVRQCCRQWVEVFGGKLISITESEWTGGHGKQKHRLVAVRIWPEIKDISDPRYDIADAIAMAEWWRSFMLHKGKECVGDKTAMCCCFLCGTDHPGAVAEISFCGETVQICADHLKPEKPRKRRKEQNGQTLVAHG